jgi:hypothetical protein
VTLNGKIISRDTETDLVLAPVPYWQPFLQPRLEKLLQKKLGHNGAKSDDTNVVVSATGRSERDLIKRFDELDIDWLIVEKHLVKWSATHGMCAELAAQVDAEEGSTGQPPIWKDVYKVMRCPGPPCQLGPRCWRDPDGKKHYKLTNHPTEPSSRKTRGP